MQFILVTVLTVLHFLLVNSTSSTIYNSYNDKGRRSPNIINNSINLSSNNEDNAKDNSVRDNSVLDNSIIDSSIDTNVLEESSNKYAIGIDFGTESVRIGLFSCASGDLVHSSSCSYTTYHPRPGWAEQSPAEWWDSLGKASRTMIQEATAAGISVEQIVGLGMDTTACTVLVLDKEMK